MRFNSKSISRSLLFNQNASIARNCQHSALNYSTNELPPFNHTPQPYTGPSYDEVLEMRKKYVNPCTFMLYSRPFMPVEGKMQYLFDEKGDRYLDTFAGIVTVSVGHSHPKVNKAVIDQVSKLQHTSTIYLTSQMSQYAKELADKMPGNLKNVFFVNSGSEANDLAVHMARLYTGNYSMVALRNGYSGMVGNAMGLTALGTWKYKSPHGFGIHHVMNPDPYRGAFTGADAGDKYAADVKDVLNQVCGNNVAGFLAESIQGVGGSIVYPEGYLKKVYNMVREAGGLCIADEVQSGFGRVGSHYWGFESEGVMPDIVTMSKGIGNGFPLGAVVTTPEIAEVLTRKLFFNTFGGNPVSMEAGRAVLRVIDEEKIQENCRVLGKRLMDGLKALQGKYEIIGDVRGRGLMMGMELVLDRKTKQPATAEVGKIMEIARDHHVLLGKGGLYGNVFRIKPPMCITEQDIDYLLYVFDKSLEKVSKA